METFIWCQFFLQLIFVSFQSSDVPQGFTPLETVGGEEIVVHRNPAKTSVISQVDTAHVTTFDVFATNGVIHVIDTVI